MIACSSEGPLSAVEDPIERELREIEDLRRRALASRDILYCSPIARHLVEREMPRLIEIIRQLRQAGGDGIPPFSGQSTWRLLSELRKEVQVVRDLIELR